jgi:hypothetical protein
MNQLFDYSELVDHFIDEELIDEAHRKGKRPSTQQKHQKGVKRLLRDRGREKGDKNRDAPRKRPKNWQGPWPPKKKSDFDDFDWLDGWNEFEDSRFDLAVRPISPWPSLLRQADAALQKALRALGPPANSRNFTHALSYAEALIYRAARELRRVTSSFRQNRILDHLGNTLMRIRAARAQAAGSSLIPGARSFIDPKVSIRGAIEQLRLARQAVGLRIV